MFHSSAQAPCRLTARRRLALGGLALTTALVAGAVASTPAFAAPSTEVHTFAELDAALRGTDALITLATDFDDRDKPSTGAEEVTTSKTLDLNGQQSVNLDQTTIGDGVEFTVIDSSPTDGSTDRGSVYFNADHYASVATPGVQLGDGATLHVSGASIFATGADGGAGIGSTSGNATFIADDGATVFAHGGDRTASGGGSGAAVDGGGAGIGGSAGQPGLDVTVGDASVRAIGGTGAAGIGGGSGGDGAGVHLEAGASVDAGQGAPLGTAVLPASSIGAGQEAAVSGALRIDENSTLTTSNSSPLVLRSGAVVSNRGRITIDARYSSADAIAGEGTVENLGEIDGFDNDGLVDPADFVNDPHVRVTGYNYDLTVVPNGGTIAGATQAHLFSASVSGLVPFYGGVTAPSDDTLFWKWTTQADGSGTVVPQTYDSTDDLTAVGISTDGAALPVTLYAQYGRTPAATQNDLADGVVGRAYDQALPVSGDGITSYRLAGPQSSSDQGSVLPAGLSIDSTTGRITGTPTAAFDGDVVFDVTGVGENLITFHLTVGGAPVFASAGLPAGTAGDHYSSQLTVGGADRASFSVVSGALPAGLSLSESGFISGTPTAAVSSSFTVRATTRFGSTDRAFALVIGAAVTVSSAPVLGSAPPASVQFGHQVTLAVTADSALPVTYKVIGGSLPKGVTLDAKTGVISGAAVESGTFTVLLRATNSAGSTDAVVVIKVAKAIELIKAKPVAPTVVGAKTVPVKVSGFKKGERWTVRVDGKTVAHGTTKKAGSVAVSVHLKKAAKDKVHTIVVSGSRKVTDPSKRAATVITVASLSAKKTLKVHSVSFNGTKLVAVEKLAVGEKVVIKDGSKVIARGKASTFGIFTFPQSKAGKGTSKLTVHGATAKRAGRLTVKNAKP